MENIHHKWVYYQRQGATYRRHTQVSDITGLQIIVEVVVAEEGSELVVGEVEPITTTLRRHVWIVVLSPCQMDR